MSGAQGVTWRAAAVDTFDDGVLESLRQVVTLLLVLGVTELVFGFLQLPLQPLQAPLLLLRLALRLLLQPLCHPAPQEEKKGLQTSSSVDDSAPPPSFSLFLMVDVPQTAPAQVPAGLAVCCLLDLSAQSSQHRSEP